MIMRMVVGIVWLLLVIFLCSSVVVMKEIIFNFNNIWFVIVILYMNMWSCDDMWLSELIIVLNFGMYELFGFCRYILK